MTAVLETLKAALSLAALPPKLTVAEWAEEYRYLSSEASSKPGKWHSMPWQLRPMEDITDPEVESITLMWASQVAGKTEVLNNAIGYFIDHDPCAVLILQPRVDDAEGWSKERLAPMLRDTPKLRGLVRDAKSRDANNTILVKAFPGGFLAIVGTNAPAGLARRPIRVLLCDEVDRYPASAGKEGDPISLAEMRTESYWDAVKIFTSTPTIKGASRIESLFNGGQKLEDGSLTVGTDKQFFFVPCPKCGVFQTLKWSQVKWPKGPNDEDLTSEAYYLCENAECGKHWTDEERQAAIWRGEWRATAPFRGKRGYHMNGIYVLFKPQKGFKTRLHQMADKFLKSKAEGKEALKAWTNTFLAETWEEEGEQPEALPLMERCEGYGPVLPAGVLVLTAGADVHPNRVELTIYGWGAGEECWIIEATTIMGNLDREEIKTAVDQWLLEREWQHAGGSKLRVVRSFMDSGNNTAAVYDFVKKRHVRGVYAVKGSATPGSPLVGKRCEWGKRKVTGFLIGTDTAKGIIYERLKIMAPGPRYVHFPLGFGVTEEFFLQLTAEKLTTEFRNGFPRRVWIQTRDRNEELDKFVYGLAAVKELNPNWGALAKNMGISQQAGEPEKKEKKAEEKPAEPKPEVAVVSAVRRPVARRRGNWVNGWRQ
jgi:phage terminase large subunit GpA-like protein